MTAANVHISEPELKKLEARVEQLIQGYELLKRDNEVLRKQYNALSSERDMLAGKTSQARTRVAAVIERLKVLEREA